MKKCIIFHTQYRKLRLGKSLVLFILFFLSGIGSVFAQTNCIEPLEDIHPELKGLIQRDELEPFFPKIPKPEIIIDWTEKIH
jgi:hypothetical protein